MRCRMLVAVAVWAAAAQADDLVQGAADRVFAAFHDQATATLRKLAEQEHPDPWLVAEELCVRRVHDAATAFAAATRQEELVAYVASREGKEPDVEARRALRTAHRLRMENAGDEAWAILSGIERPADPVLRIRLNTLRAKTLRDLDDHPRSDRYFLHAGKLAHQLGWRRRTTESLCYVAYRYCFGTAGGASRMWLVRRKLVPGEAAVVYARPPEDLLAAVITAERTWYVPLGAMAPIEAARAAFHTPRAGAPVLVDELRARVVEPLGLGKGIRRVFVVPIKPLIDLPWVLLLGDREVVLGRDDDNVTAFGDDVPAFGVREEEPYGDGVLAIGRPRREGSTAAEQEVRAVGDTILLGERATWDAVDEAAASQLRWRALHIACPSTVAEEWSPPHRQLDDLMGRWTLRRRWLDKRETELLVLSVDNSFRLVHEPVLVRGPPLHAPRAIVSLWEVDPQATRVLMRRFYALWNGKVVSLPACTALKLAQDFVRSHAVWRHPYYWAGWQLWASRDPAKRE